MHSPVAPAADLSALAWVQEELRKSLESAHKALRRYLRDAQNSRQSDLDDVEPSVLRQARAHVHQGVGALELVAMPEGALLLRASEALVQRCVARPQRLDGAAVEAVEQASFALLDYIGRRLAGKSASALALFPQLRTLLEAQGAERVHPADLWAHDWRWRDVPAASVVQLHHRPTQAAMQADVERRLLSLVRTGAADAAAGLTRDCAWLAQEAAAGNAESAARAAAFWRLAAAFFEAWGLGLVAPDVFAKRTASRVMGQLRAQAKGDTEVSERLAQDLLFYCARAWPPQGVPAPWLGAVQRAWQLVTEPVTDYLVPLYGRHDPALLTLARKRVAAAKEAWNGAAAQEAHRLEQLPEAFALLGDVLRRLSPPTQRLGEVLARVAAQSAQRARAPVPALAMEVATSLLYLEAALEDGEFEQAAQADRAARLAERIEAVAGSAAPAPLDPWMEELYRRVSDRQTLGSVVHELRATLGDVESRIDHYFRHPHEREGLRGVPLQLADIRKVLSVLGVESATQAAVRMRDDVEWLLETDGDPRRADTQACFQRLAGNLGALGFLIDMVGVQLPMARALFRYDAGTGLLAPLMGRSAMAPDLVDRAQAIADAVRREDTPIAAVSAELDALARTQALRDQPVLASSLSAAQAALEQADAVRPAEAVRADVAQALDAFVARATRPADLQPVAPSLVSRPIPIDLETPPVFQPTGLEGDDEMRAVFLEEAHEVLEQARQGLRALEAAPADMAALTSVRRAFHTLKGSSRMVGLAAFGEAAWSCEQLYNHWLALQAPASTELRTFTGDALAYVQAWVQAIGAGHDEAIPSEPVIAAADALRLAGELMRVHLPGELQPALPEAAAAPEVGLVELDLEVPSESPPTPVLTTLQATQPLELMPAWAQAAVPQEFAISPSQLIDLAIDLGRTAAQPVPPAVDEPSQPVDLDLGEPAEVPAAVVDLPLDDLGVPMMSLQDEPSPSTETPVTPVVPVEPVEPAGWPWGTDWPVDAASMETVEVSALPEAHDSPPSWRAPLQSSTTLSDPAALAGGDVPSVSPDPSASEVPAADVAPVLRLDDYRPAPDQLPEGLGDDQIKVIGDLRLQIPLFNIYLNEADELSRQLSTELALWALELHRPVGGTAVALAHSLAGSSSTVGFAALAQLARLLEHALERADLLGSGQPDDAALFSAVADEIRRLLHQFAAGFLHQPPDELVARLSLWMEAAVARTPDPSALPPAPAWDDSDGLPALALAPPPAPEPAVPDVEPALPELPPLPPEQAEAGMLDLDLPSPVDAEALTEISVPAEFIEPPADLAWPELGADGLPLVREPLSPTPTPTAEAEPGPAPLPLPPALPALGHDESASVQAQPLDLALPPVPDAQALLALSGPVPATLAPAGPGALATDGAQALDEDIDQVDQVDAQLFPIFEEEAEELLPLLAQQVEAWLAHPADGQAGPACMRSLHTFKGSARLAGAMRLGELAHRCESAVGRLLGGAPVERAALEAVQQRVDHLSAAFETLREHQGNATPSGLAVLGVPSGWGQPGATTPPAAGAAAATVAPAGRPSPASVPAHDAGGMAVVGADAPIDWSRFLGGQSASLLVPADRSPVSAQPVRVRAPLLDRLVNLAGEVSITRTRLEAEVGQIRASLADLTDNLERLNQQLHDVALQAETQLESRMEAARAAAQAFDPLELDRYTRLQELTRMMAESVNDVATVRSTLQRTLQTTEDELAVQARLTRELQSDLLRTRMIEFESLSERLYRVVRQASKETGKQVRFDIVGGAIEVDRGVLDRMTAAFEHLLRNCVTHGIEAPEARRAAGKDPTGSIVVGVEQEGNEVSVEIRDDGAGLDLVRIKSRAIEMGLIRADATPSDKELASLIMAPGLSTMSVVTELAGRGVGMDVVRADVQALGGRVETRSSTGRGTRFKLVLPLTTVVTQVVILRAGDRSIAVPSNLVELVQRVTPPVIDASYEVGSYAYGGLQLPFYWLGALMQASARGTEVGRTLPVVVVRSAQQRVALHVDEVQGSHEVVVKNLGPQLSRLAGLAGMTLLPSGAVALIYNPVALAAVYGAQARQLMQRALQAPEDAPPVAGVGDDLGRPAPLVLVVDDSLTVRRITKRLLEREGWRVALAKDGLDALDVLAGERPVAVLSDIEMPRMDGFDLLRNIRGDARLADLPVIMITSRIAQKHRDIALELGANHYLGKPYREEELLALIRGFAQVAADAA